MIQVWNEFYSQSTPKFNNYKVRENKVQKFEFLKSFDDIINYSQDYTSYKHIFILDESRFSFIRFDVFEKFEKELTIHTLNDIIKYQLNTQLKKYNFQGEKIKYFVDNIFVDGEPKKYFLGEKGEIFFKVYLIFIHKKSLNIFNSIYGNVLKNNKIDILPQSFYTVMFLKNILKKENFLLIYITDNYCKTINIKNGFYCTIEILNLGINSLKQMYKDNDIIQFWEKSLDYIESNPLAKNLIEDSLKFFVNLLCKWMNDKGIGGSDVIVVSPLIKNTNFIEIFNQEYSKMYNNYVVPFHFSKELDGYGLKLNPQDIDFITLINSI